MWFGSHPTNYPSTARSRTKIYTGMFRKDVGDFVSIFRQDLSLVFAEEKPIQEESELACFAFVVDGLEFGD